MKNLFPLLAALLLFTSCGEKTIEKQLHEYVNPFIGASTSVGAAGVYHGLGKTFPGATTPFGMTQVSPNTITGGDNGSGYSYEHRTIEGFAFTQMSGVGWFGELGNFLVMPTTGELKTVAGKEGNDSLDGYRSHYDKTSEKASAGYYSVHLTDYDVQVETTATPRGGILRFTYPQHEQSRIQIDLARRVGGTSTEQYLKVIDDRRIQGWMKCPAEGGGWGNSDGYVDYTVHFFAEFSKPMTQIGFWSADIPEGQVRLREETQSLSYLRRVENAIRITDRTELQGKHIGFYSEFPTERDEEVTLKVAISFVDMDGAKNNFDQELADYNFDQVKANAECDWNTALSKIQIEGGTDDEKTIFYTALYHTFIDPRLYTDVDGRYVGGDKGIYQADGFTKRTVFSGWDVFRTQFPLQTIINPEVVNDALNSLITLAEQSGREYFERWELANAYSGCMIGNPALPVLTDAYKKDIRDYDVEKAYRYAVNSSEKFSSPDERGHYGSSLCISNTLEYGFADWALGELAKELGKTEDAERYQGKGQFYRNIYDPGKEWFRPRKDNGEWEDWPEEALIKEWYGCIESNPYQQGWFVPHDVEGLVELIGGRERTLSLLDTFFENTPENMLWNQYYNHANEPVHHVPFLYNRLGTPWKTQEWTRKICERAYFNDVEGLVGNEDAGQMSAWYVMAAAGLYPLCPGEAVYEITSPVFDEITFAMPASGKLFTVRAIDNSKKNVYIQSATLNGEPYTTSSITHDQLLNGGTLELLMGDEPNKDWGVK